MRRPTRPPLLPLPTLPLLTGVALAIVTSLTLRAQTDDFNDGNDTGWTRYNVFALLPGFAQWSFPNGGYRIRTTMASPDPVNFGPGRAGSYRAAPTYTDFYASVDILDWDHSLDQAFGILARITNPGPGTTDGYAFTCQIGDGVVSIARIFGEVPGDVGGTSQPVTLDPAKQYRLAFLGIGSTLEGRVYELPDVTTPILVVSGIDEVHTSGICGLVVFDNSATADGLTDATYDNYLAAAQEPAPIEPPTLTFSRPSAGQFAVSWPSAATGFVLQRTSALTAAPSWTDVTAGIVDNGGVKTYTETMSASPAWFRMKQ